MAADAFVPAPVVRASSESFQTAVDIPSTLTTGRVIRVMHADGTELWLLLLPGTLVKMGRKHLWHVRREVAATRPADVRECLMRIRLEFITHAREDEDIILLCGGAIDEVRALATALAARLQPFTTEVDGATRFQHLDDHAGPAVIDSRVAHGDRLGGER